MLPHKFESFLFLSEGEKEEASLGTMHCVLTGMAWSLGQQCTRPRLYNGSVIDGCLACPSLVVEVHQALVACVLGVLIVDIEISETVARYQGEAGFSQG